MDRDLASRRFRTFTSSTSPNFASPGDLPAPQYRRDSSGSESVSSHEGRVAFQAQHPQGTQEHYGVPRAPISGGISPFSAARQPPNANATLYVEDPPFIQGSPHSSQGSQTSQGDFNAHYAPAVSTYDVPMAATIAPYVPQPGSHGPGSEGSSPGGSSQGGDSDHSVGSKQSVSTGTSGRSATQGTHAMQMGGAYTPAGGLGFTREHYPAYDANARRIGLEHVRYDALPHQGTGQSYYRARTHTYPRESEGPQVLNISLDAPSTPATNAPSPDIPLSTDPISHIERMSTREGEPAPSAAPTPAPIQISMSVSPPPARLPPAFPVETPAKVLHPLPADIPDPTPNLRQLLGLGPDEEVSLYSLADPRPGEKPNYPYPTLIKLAIHGSARKRLTLQEIYATLEERFEWFEANKNDKAWQNSIRHQLSLNKCFRRVAKPIAEPGKGSYWVVDYSQGEGNKRARKRNKRPTKAELAARRALEQQEQEQQDQEQQDQEESSEDDPTGTPSPIPGSSHSQTSSASASASASTSQVEDAYIDPELRNEGHVIGQMRMRSTTTSARAAVRRQSPYAASPAPVPLPLAAQQQRTQMRATPGPANAALNQVTFAQPAYTAASYAQPAFGQTSFPQPPQQQPRPRQPAFGQPSFAAPAAPVAPGRVAHPMYVHRSSVPGTPAPILVPDAPYMPPSAGAGAPMVPAPRRRTHAAQTVQRPTVDYAGGAVAGRGMPQYPQMGGRGGPVPVPQRRGSSGSGSSSSSPRGSME